jgi:dihydroneopterin aldolase
MKTEIYLQGMEFHAFHGVYPEEKKLGNRFRVEIRMWLNVPFNPGSEDLSAT